MSITQVPDREILIELFNANRYNTLQWDLQDETMDSWIGVTHSQGKVTKLDLHNKHIDVIPSSFSGLINLVSLDLSNNTTLSDLREVGNLTPLGRLDISHNNLTSIPQKLEISLI